MKNRRINNRAYEERSRVKFRPYFGKHARYSHLRKRKGKFSPFFLIYIHTRMCFFALACPSQGEYVLHRPKTRIIQMETFAGHCADELMLISWACGDLLCECDKWSWAWNRTIPDWYMDCEKIISRKIAKNFFHCVRHVKFYVQFVRISFALKLCNIFIKRIWRFCI